MKRTLRGFRVIRTQGHAKKPGTVAYGTVRVLIQDSSGARRWIELPEDQYRRECRFEK